MDGVSGCHGMQGSEEGNYDLFSRRIRKTPIFYYIWDEFDDRIVSISESSRRVA
jgi:hypothetical protein